MKKPTNTTIMTMMGVTVAMTASGMGCAGPSAPPMEQPRIAVEFATAPVIPPAFETAVPPRIRPIPKLRPAARNADNNGDEIEWPALITGVDLTSDRAKMLRALAAGDDDTAFRAAYRMTREAPLDLQAAVVAVMARNPELRAARENLFAVETEHGQLDALRRVQQHYRAFLQTAAAMDAGPLSAAAEPMEGEAFPLPGPIGVQVRLIDEAAKIAHQQVLRTYRQLARETHMAMAATAFWQQMGEILRDQHRLAQTVRELERSRYETGSVGLGGLLMIDARLAQLENARADAARQFAAQTATLARLMALDAGPTEQAATTTIEAVVMPSTPTATLDAEPFAQRLSALATHPDLRTLDHQIDRMRLMVQMLEAMNRPPADLGFSRLPSPLSDMPTFGDMRPMPPAPWYGLAEAYRAELSHRIASLKATLAAETHRLREAAVTAWLRAKTASAERTLQMQTLDALAEQAVTTAREAFRTGAAEIDRVLAALDSRLETALAAVDATRDLAMAMAELDFLLGPLGE